MSEWKPIETAPKDGTRFLAKGPADKYARYPIKRRRITWYGKVSHIPLYGWCHGRDPEDVSTWDPTHWKPRDASGGGE
jgi:hypothetical protein